MKKNSILSGSHSVNVGQQSSVANSNFHIGDIHNYKADEQYPEAYIDRIHTKPLSIAGNPIKTGWLVISSVLGLFGSFASLIMLPSNLLVVFISLILIVLTTSCFVIGFSLLRQRFYRIPYLPFNFEADKVGRIFITKIEGECPFCDGKLKLTEIGEEKETLLVCTRNPKHTWEFDFTILGEPQS